MTHQIFLKRYIFSRTQGSVVKSIALISVGGMTLGVAALVVVLSVMEGFDGAITKRLLGIQPHLIITQPFRDLEPRLEKVFKSHPTTSLYKKQDILLRTGEGLYSGAVAYGVDQKVLPTLAKRIKSRVQYLDSVNGAVVKGSTETTNIDFKLESKEIIVGIDLARSLGIFEGDEVNVIAPESLLLPSGEMPIYEKVKVRALFGVDVPDIDAHMIIYNVSSGLRKLKDTASLESGWEVRFKDPYDALKYSSILRDQENLPVLDWEDMNKALFYSLKMEKRLMGTFLVLTLLVASFSIVSVLVLLVTEKTKDIGVLRSLGATRYQVRQIFMRIGVFLGLFGIGSGALLGLGICIFMKKYPIIKLPDIYYDTTFPVTIEWSAVLAIIVFGFILSWLGSLLPSSRISQIDPVKALRRG